MIKSHIIWGNYPETDDLILELQQHEFDMITVIDDDMKHSLKRQGDIVYAKRNYVEAARLSQVIEYHYYYIPPFRRIGGNAWKVKKVIGLIHEFKTYKKR